MTRKEAVGLYYAIQNLKNGKMETDTLYAFVSERLKLRAIAQEFEDFRDALASSENEKDALIKWLNEPFKIERVFTLKEAIELGQYNDSTGQVIDEIATHLVKK